MARITDKSADSTSGEVPSPKTDGSLDPIPEDLTKKNEQSLILPTPLADVETYPNRFSEVMDSATIDASSGAIPGDSPTTVEQEISGLLASGSNAHQSNTAMQVPLVPTTTKDGLFRAPTLIARWSTHVTSLQRRPPTMQKRRQAFQLMVSSSLQQTVRLVRMPPH